MTPARNSARKRAQSRERSEHSHSKLVAQVKRILSNNLSTHGMREPVRPYADKQRRNLYDLITRAVTLGESNSVLVTGPRGSGKTSLIHSVLQDVSRQSDVMGNFLLVELNGLVHTDDRIALRDITRQLRLENAVGDKVFGSFSENFTFLLESLKSGDQQSKSIVFILEEFDLFCYHKNQTLLYNLFDVAQSAQAPVMVVGVTCRLDAIELLEKRVKSRFSHRQLHLFNEFSFEEYLNIIMDHLSLPSDFPCKQLRDEWNSSVQTLVQESGVWMAMKRQYSTNKDIRAMKQLLLAPVKQLSEQNLRLSASDIVESQKQLLMDSKVALLKGLSVLELSLVVAMLHLTKIYDGEPFNFEMVYKEYQKFISSKSTPHSTGKSIVMKAFQHLEMLELVRPLSSFLGNVQYEFRLMRLLVEPAQVQEVLHKAPSLPTDVSQWAASILSGRPG
ncbi:origin recognition complex subunit 4 [Ixodes scapularis]|uniref:origin recognition complex subunit 4 n=1 Tax=Ixodes scapularis TaxID=6945 RepID=UPI001A9E94E0|nr:origin recognition complex subunit 4 [Ixodes scapularis]